MERRTRHGLVPTTDELRANLRVVAFWRWITGAGAIALGVLGPLVPETDFRPLPLLLIGAVHLIYNLLVWFTITRRPDRMILVAYGEIILDMTTLILIFHFTGGVESPCLIYLLIHLFGTGLLLSPYASVAAIFVAILPMTLVALLERGDQISHINIWGEIGLYRNDWYIGTILLAFFLSCLLLVALGVRVASQLRQQHREAVALYEAAQVITSTLDTTEVLNRLLEACATTLNASAGIVRLLSPDGNQLVFAAGFGLSDSYIEKGTVEFARSAIDHTAILGRPVIIDDVRAEQRVMYQKSMLAEGILSGLVVPIPGFDGHVLGVLRVYSRETNHFSQQDIPFIKTITSQAGIALSNALQYQSLAEIDEAKSRFLRTVTHELRSPVAGAQSLMRNLTQGFAGELTTQQRDILLRIEGRLDFLQELITDLLDLAAGREHQLFPQKGVALETLNVTESLRRVCDGFKDQAAAKDIEFESNVDFLPALWVRAETESLRRILANLVSNAIKYTPPQGHVEANLSWDEDWLEFKVRDSGMGIPADDLPHLFQEFYRARNARQTQPHGTGLGLAIVKQLVTLFEGQIGVLSVEGDGSTFTVNLPLLAVGENPDQQAGNTQ